MKQLCLLFLLISSSIFAQEKFTLSGYAKDADSGETLIGAYVYNSAEKTTGTTTNVYGFYSLTLPAGTYQIAYSYIGFETTLLEIELDKDIALNVELTPEGVTLDDEVVVTSKRKDENVSSTQMGTVELGVDKIKKLPAFMGEVDVLKTIQLLPGVQASGEGNSGFYVRGGGADQNLILLDEATVYNTGHLFGFFSVFNADAIKNTTIIKGGMPAKYGSRLSSVLDISMKEGNNKRFAGQGGIGLISSRLTLEGPIVKNKGSFIVSGRRTYASEIAQPAINKTDFKGSGYYFYDVNAKVNYTISDKDRIFLSGYFGRDVFSFKNNERDFNFNIPWGNVTATMRWNHLFNDKMFMNLTAVYNSYNFKFEGGQENFSFEYFSGIKDWNAKVDFDYFPSIRHKVKFGANYTWHTFEPSVFQLSISGDGGGDQSEKQITHAHESAVYIQDEWDVTTDFSMNVGVRATLFNQVGPYEFKDPDSGEITTYERGDNVVNYPSIEPRLSMRYRINDDISLKAGITYNTQYVHLVTQSGSTLPTDTWLPSSKKIKPQKGWQYSVGYFQNFADGDFEASVELFYKSMKNQIDYNPFYFPELGERLEDQFVFGKGRAYGAEFFLKKRYGKLNGWVGYTFSRSLRTYAEINNGDFFPSSFDTPHDLSFALNYEPNKKLTLGLVWVYGSGKPFTPSAALYNFGGGNLPFEALDPFNESIAIYYGPRNSERIPDYHRMDFSLTYTPDYSKRKRDRKFKSSYNFSIYNLYNRKNVLFVYLDTDINETTGTYELKYVATSLFPMIPSFTWNFEF